MNRTLFMLKTLNKLSQIQSLFSNNNIIQWDLNNNNSILIAHLVEVALKNILNKSMTQEITFMNNN